MNTYTFVGALVIAGIYLLLRFLEMRFVGNLVPYYKLSLNNK